MECSSSLLFALFLFFLFVRTIVVVILQVDTEYLSRGVVLRAEQQRTQLVITNSSGAALFVYNTTTKATHRATGIAQSVHVEEEVAQRNRSTAIYLLHCSNQVKKLHGIRWALNRLLAYIRHTNAYGPVSSELHIVERTISSSESLAKLAQESSWVMAFLMSSQRNGVTCLSRPSQNTFKEHRVLRVSRNGEVFDKGLKYNCNYVDLVIDRSKQRTDYNREMACVGAHTLQGLAYASPPHETFRPEKLCVKRDDAWLEAVTSGPPRKAAIVSVSRLIKRSKHSFQALIRAAFFAKLAERLSDTTLDATPGLLKEIGQHRPYGKVPCPGGPLDTTECKKMYKFSIDMENSAVLGYVSEKVFTGLLANSVPIYFGAPDIAEYINPKRIVICSIPEERLEELEKHKVYKTFVFGNVTIESDNYNASKLFDLAVDAVGEDLRECLDETVELYHDEAKYLRKLMEDPFTNQKEVCIPDGSVLGPIGKNLFNAVETLYERNGLERPSSLYNKG